MYILESSPLLLAISLTRFAFRQLQSIGGRAAYQYLVLGLRFEIVTSILVSSQLVWFLSSSSLKSYVTRFARADDLTLNLLLNFCVIPTVSSIILPSISPTIFHRCPSIARALFASQVREKPRQHR